VGDAPDLPVRTSEESAIYLREVCQLLWPPPAEVTFDGDTRPEPGRSPDSPGSEFILIPSRDQARLVVPAMPRLAAAAIRHHRMPRTWPTRLAWKALSLGLASGLGGTVVRGRLRVTEPSSAETIESYLRDAISPDLRVSMYLGTPRANRKPVLQLLSPAGAPLGFAKIGVNPLTRELVRAERAALSRLERAGLSQARVPRVMHYGEWRGLEVMVTTALPVWLRRTPAPDGQLAAAMAEVARIGGLVSGPLAASSYHTRLAARLAEADQSPSRADLLNALDVLVERSGGTELTYGAWHGDWSPWNMSSTGEGLLLWDWERFTCDVPLGFDPLHHWLQTEIGPRRAESGAAAAECIDRAAQLVAPIGVAVGQARLTATLYLADLATRYLVDRQARAGARLGDPGTWLIPAITREVARLRLQPAR
jgi:hypothetical protein